MGNPVTYANLGDLRSAEEITQEFLYLKEREDGFFKHPAIVYAGAINGGSSATLTVGHVGLGGYDLMTATAEGTAATSTTLTTGASQITVGRYSLQREVGDLARMTDKAQLLQFDKFAADAVSSFVATVVDLAANVIDGYTLTQDATTTMTIDDFAAAKAKIGQFAGPYLAILHTKQWGELEREIGGTAGGAVAYDPASAELISRMGPGFKGRLMGVDVYVTERVISSGGLRKGAILAPGALVWGNGIPPVNDPNQEILAADLIKFSQDRQPSKGTCLWVADGYVGVSMGVDARGVTLTSAA